MKEKEFINIIKNTLQSKYIGDDCAFLKDLGIVITQDNLVEDVHFSLQFTNAYKLGYKSVMVNISDICASGAEPAYITIGLSLSNDKDTNFIEEFYRGAKDACRGKIEIVGGDITGSDKTYISITALGKTQGRKISSRSHAKIGQKVILSGPHGASAAGLQQLYNGVKSSKFIEKHLMPEARENFSRQIAQNVKEDYAMMDTSDGLMDALSTIASESGVLLSIDFDKIPFDNDLKQFENWQDLLFFGGEDYELVATVPVSDAQGFIIGEVKAGQGVEINYSDKIVHYAKEDVEKKLYNHFKEK